MELYLLILAGDAAIFACSSTIVSAMGFVKLMDVVYYVIHTSDVQVMELTQQIKSMFEDIETEKKNVFSATEAERKAVAAMEKMKIDCEISLKAQEDSQAKLLKELSAVRQDLSDTRSKAKISQESKNKTEIEIVNVRQELSHLESEFLKLQEYNRTLAANNTAVTEKLQTAITAGEHANEQVSKLRSRIKEMESQMEDKSSAIERLNMDVVEIEKEGLMEIRRLRVQLNSAEQEINELRPMIPILQKELADSKANFSRVQNSSSSNVNNLMEELRVAEDNLAKERKKNQSVVDGHTSKISELTVALEQTKAVLEEVSMRTKVRHLCFPPSNSE
jgi:chromosome segregation ATPase